MSVVCSVLSLFKAFQGLELSIVLPIGKLPLHMAQLLLFAATNYRGDVRQGSKHSFLGDWHVFVIEARSMAVAWSLIQFCLATSVLL